MKKVFLALAVAAVFVACDSKKKEEEKPVVPVETPTTPPAGDTGKITPSPTGDTGKGKTAMENAKDAINKGGEAVKDVKTGDMKSAGENGKGAVESAKKAVAH